MLTHCFYHYRLSSGPLSADEVLQVAAIIAQFSNPLTCHLHIFTFIYNFA